MHLKPRTRPLTIRKDTLNRLSFWLLTALCVLNLNFVVRILFDLNRAASGLILLTSIACVLSARKSIAGALGKPGLSFMLFFVLYVGIAVLSGPFDTLAMSVLQQYAGTIIIVIAAACCGWRLAQSDSLEKSVLIFYGFWVSTAAIILMSDSIRQSTGMTVTYDEARMAGVFGNPNEAGVAAAVAFGMGFALLGARRWRGAISIGMLICGLAALSTFSKMAILITLAVSILQMLLPSAGSRTRNTSRFFALIMMVAFAWLFTIGVEQIEWGNTQLARLMELKDLIVNLAINDDTTTNRSSLIEIGFSNFLEHPVFGQGLGSFHEMEGAAGSGAHNTYLVVAGEAGIVGFAPFLLFLALWTRESLRCKDAFVRQLCLIYIAAFALHCFSSHSVLELRYHNIMLGLSFGLLSGRSRYLRSSSKSAAATEAASDSALGRPSASGQARAQAA